MNVPTIGGARGVFEIFVPGAFMLINVIAFIYLLPVTANETKQQIVALLQEPVQSLILAVIFGYLMGVILRLFRTEFPDKLSARWLRRFSKQARKDDGTFHFYVIEEFPYIRWLGIRHRDALPSDVIDFYNRVWAPRAITQQSNSQFFNYCKNMILTTDNAIKTEIYAAESLSRYIASMFYALSTASTLLLLTFLLRGLILGPLDVPPTRHPHCLQHRPLRHPNQLPLHPHQRSRNHLHRHLRPPHQI